eukprot:12786521-Alexandrium_andersonii.AAC.1
MAEVRVLLGGSCLIMAVPIDLVHGATLQKKIETVVTKPGAEAFLEQCTHADGRGFVCYQQMAGSC